MASKGSNSLDKITIVPLYMGVFAFAICAWLFVAFCGFYATFKLNDSVEYLSFLESVPWFWAFHACISIFTCFLPKQLFALWTMKSLHIMMRDIRRFSIQASKCSDENDRTFVEGYVETNFGSFEVFDKVVRGCFTELVNRSVGTTCSRQTYWMGHFCCSTFLLSVTVYGPILWVFQLSGKMDYELLLRCTVFGLWQTFVFCPLVFAVTSGIGYLAFNMRPIRATCTIALANLVGSLIQPASLTVTLWCPIWLLLSALFLGCIAVTVIFKILDHPSCQREMERGD